MLTLFITLWVISAIIVGWTCIVAYDKLTRVSLLDITLGVLAVIVPVVNAVLALSIICIGCIQLLDKLSNVTIKGDNQ